jgi:DNA repair exonuclease SbcCD ATPase subunit
LDGYKIITNGKTKRFSAMNKKVPEAVTALLNMTEVNVQKQLSSPFLLAGSAGEAARFLNGIIKLDKIDTVLTNADMLHRKYVKAKNVAEAEVETCVTSLKALEWVDAAQEMCDKIKKLDDRITKNKEKYDDIINSKEKLKTFSAAISGCSRIIAAEELATAAQHTIDIITAQQDKLVHLEHIKENIDKFNALIDIDFDFNAAKELIETANKTSKYITDMKIKYNTLVNMKVIIERETATIINTELKISKLNAAVISMDGMPCPTCGEPLNKNHIIHKGN